MVSYLGWLPWLAALVDAIRLAPTDFEYSSAAIDFHRMDGVVMYSAIKYRSMVI